MTRPSPFSFNRDFRAVEALEQDAALAGIPQEQYDADMIAAEERGFANGERTGREAATVAEAARMAQAVERLGMVLGQSLETVDMRLAESERHAVELALACARKIAGHALAHYPLAAIEDTARACFTEARSSPHVVVRVNDAHVEAIKERLTRIATEKGFAGKLAVLGDPEIPQGDGRLEWADGGFVHDRAETERLIAKAVNNYLRTSVPVAVDAQDEEGAGHE
jgi:flagellar assembly protein FliH